MHFENDELKCIYFTKQTMVQKRNYNMYVKQITTPLMAFLHSHTFHKNEIQLSNQIDDLIIT